MRSDVEREFDNCIRTKLQNYPDLQRIMLTHGLKSNVVDRLCEEIIIADKKLDLTYDTRWNQIVHSAAHLYMRRLVSTLEYEAKSTAEKTRIKKEEDQDKKINDILDTNIPITDKMLLDD